ncbi:MAG: hypothetical protein ACI9DG_002659 [Oleispira sp.]|jgi:hypothetical protein
MSDLNNIKLLGYACKEGMLVHISEVDTGLACGCICPNCGERLIARKGEMNEHHFAHDHNSDCIGAYESALHLLAKEVVSQGRELFMPELEIEVSLVGFDGIELFQKDTASAYILQYGEVQVEQAVDDYRPDLTLILEPKIIMDNIYYGMEPYIDVEIKVTHGIDEEKLAKVKAAGRPMMEIDVSEADPMANRTELEHWITYHAPRYWVYHPYQDFREEKLLDKLGLLADEQAVYRSASPLNVANAKNVMALGYKAGKGLSKRSGKYFEMHEIYFAAPMQTHSTSNYQLLGGAGYEMQKLYIDPELGNKLKVLKYPCEVRLITGSVFNQGRLKGVVSDVEIV